MMTLSQAGSPRSRSGIVSRLRFAVTHGEYSQRLSGGGPSTMYGARNVGAAKITASHTYSISPARTRNADVSRRIARTGCPVRTNRPTRSSSRFTIQPLPSGQVSGPFSSLSRDARSCRRAPPRPRAVVVGAGVVKVPEQRLRVEAVLREPGSKRQAIERFILSGQPVVERHRESPGRPQRRGHLAEAAELVAIDCRQPDR